ncbi:uncharacterized protein O3C94_021122 [Discoglossus pictus]
MALDYVLASKGGVCALVGKECCSYIDDNSAIVTDDIEQTRDIADRLNQFQGTIWDDMFSWLGALGRTEKPPQRHLAKTLYPFQRIQIDHIQMPKSGRYEYALVIVDMFSGWPEAYPVTNMTAKTTVKRLLTEVICRYGVPEVIESDQGPAFTAVLAKEIWTALGVTLSFHTPYHPQSSGKVEHSEVITGTHQLLPGDWVLVKKFVRKTPLEPRYEGPFQVLLITATSVKLEGKTTWVHASHCKKVPPPDDQEPTQ